jgi:hypothetical protein
MTGSLFKPFDIGKWFAVGFTAFLAGLTDWSRRGGSSHFSDDQDHEFDDIADLPAAAWHWLTDHPGWFLFILCCIVFLVGLVILLTWLSSRGKFMFLDNVVHDHKLIVKPWHDFRVLGDSLFLWRLCYGIICGIIILSFFAFSFFVIYHLKISDPPAIAKILPIAGLGLAFILLIIVLGYISLFLTDFVVPLMYKHNLTAMAGWRYFLSLFTRHILYFLLYGVLVFFLNILVIICIVIFGLMTCCMGFVLLILPYISSVILLPVSYAFRAFSLEFLSQFGPDFAIFPEPGEAAGSVPAEGPVSER